MDKKAVISFFDECAAAWDKTTVRNENAISKILDISEVKTGAKVLDVACGTGVLFGDYFAREVASLTAIDISEKMTEIAKEKFPKAEVILGDAECYHFDSKFDCIVIHNAFPHFVNEMRLFENLSRHLDTLGRLTVAHSMSREDIIACHNGKAQDISKELIRAEELATKMSRFVNVDTVISDSDMYIVSGTHI